MNAGLCIAYGYDVLYLCSCALNGICPDSSRLEAMDLKSVYAVSKYHSVNSITGVAIEAYIEKYGHEKLGNYSDIVKKWIDSRKTVARRNLLFDLERHEIFSWMEREGVWHLPLKGIILKELYPKMGMRSMADNDILFDESYREKLCEYMTDRGYRVKQFGRENHDVYVKDPFYNFEMHVTLIPDGHRVKKGYGYYKDIEKRLLKDGTEHCRRFSNEDYYVYLVTHAFRHYTSAGIGIRTFCDVYVYLERFRNTLDFEYVSKELKKLGVFSFESHLRALTYKLMHHHNVIENISESLTDEEKGNVEYYLTSGTYGTVVNWTKQRISRERQGTEDSLKKAKLKYVIKRLFPPLDYYKKNHPFLYKTMIFIPAFVVYRWIKQGIVNRKQICIELRTVLKRDKK